MPFFSRDFSLSLSSSRQRPPPPSLVPPSLTSLTLGTMSRPSTPREPKTPPKVQTSKSEGRFSLPAASLSTTSLISTHTPPGATMTRSRAASLGASSRASVPKFCDLPPVPPPKGPVPTPKTSSPTHVRARERFDTFEACMEGGIKYETQSVALGHSGDVAERHLNRAAGLFAAALSYQPSSSWATLRRATVLLHLATNTYPASAIGYLREARKLLNGLTSSAPNSTSARETLATVCSRLSLCLHVMNDQADDIEEVWEGEVGRFACEALEALEEVATERMDRVRLLRRDAFEDETPALADMFLTLAEAAGTVATLALDSDTVDSHAELAEHALDQAANMATMATRAKIRSSSANAALITRVQLASGSASAERMRHMFLLGVSLEEDDFSSLIADMTLLVKETRDRASRLKGSKGAAAALQAFEALQQLGDTKALYANLLRCIWRARRQASLSPIDSYASNSLQYPPSAPTTPGLVRDSPVRASRTNSISSVLSEAIESPVIPEEPEEEARTMGGEQMVVTKSSVSSTTSFSDASKRTRAPPPPPLKIPRSSFSPISPKTTPRTPLSPLNPSSSLVRRASDYMNGARPRLSRTTGSTSATPISRSVSASSIPPVTPLPMPSPSLPLATPRRRLSSMTRPLNAWERRPSYPSLPSPAATPGFMGDSHIPTAELALTAYNLLGGALKHYKVALTLLSQAEVGSDRRARLKSEALASIASVSLFRATLVPRVRLARPNEDADDPKRLLNTAEVYSTWAAREVGWSFIIEGTPGAELVDRRTGLWEADEAGKRAVMLTLRIWWYRATSDIGADKTSAKENVARVVKRLRDLEGAGQGDVARFIAAVARMEGEIDPAEQLFWRSVKRILRGGQEESL